MLSSEARATRAARAANKPLAIVAKALKIPAKRLAMRLAYHKFRATGKTVADVVNALEEHTRSKLPPAVLKLRGNARAPPPVQNNPRQARKPQAVDDEHVGRIALQRAVNLTCEKVGTGDYDERDLSVLYAGLQMLPRKKR